MEAVQVIIIGAGAAGLSAAKALAEHPDLACIHLEAQEGVGGRVKTFASEGGPALDSGACFVHTKGLTLYREARQRGLLACSGKAALLLAGRYTPVWRFFCQHALSNLRPFKQMTPRFYRADDPRQSLGQLISALDFTPPVAGLVRSTLGSSLGCAVEQVGVLALRQSLQQANIRLGRDTIQQTLKRPLATLLAEIYAPQTARVLTGHPVTAIDYQGAAVKVQCQNGPRFVADKVIITVPLAVLQQEQIQFDPPLPAGHQQAIARLGMGQGLKLRLQFSKVFWKKRLRQLINTDGLFHFWIPDPAQAVMMVFYVAAAAEALDEQAALARVMDTLRTAFALDIAPLLVSSQLENWSANPFIGGLYSFDAIGSEGARTQLQTPVANRLYLAGEATVEGYFATVDGAIESGRRAAQQILDQLTGAGSGNSL